MAGAARSRSTGEVVVRTRNGRDISGSVPELGRLAQLGTNCVLDGKMIAGAGLPTDFYPIVGAVSVTTFPGDDLDAVLDSCEQLEMEGVVVKRRDAPYRPGQRSPHWRKVKCLRRRRSSDVDETPHHLAGVAVVDAPVVRQPFDSSRPRLSIPVDSA